MYYRFVRSLKKYRCACLALIVTSYRAFKHYFQILNKGNIEITQIIKLFSDIVDVLRKLILKACAIPE